jgi:hypothetical protein
MSDILLHMHMGLGDHLVCNGLVRKISENNKNKKIYLVVRESILKNLELLYGEQENIIPTIIPFYPKPEEIYNLNDINSPWIRSCKIYADMNDLELLTVGYYNYFHSDPWDYNFYFSQKIDYKIKYEYFNIPQNVMEDAHKKYNQYIKPIVSDKEFVFIHDDPSRKYQINYDTDKLILKNTDNIFKNFNIFDMIPILENANELRMIGSSLLCICDLLNIFNSNKKKCYYYASIRGVCTWKDINKWNIL